MYCLCPTCLKKYNFNNQTNVELLSFLKKIPNHELANFAKQYYQVEIHEPYAISCKTSALNNNLALEFFIKFQTQIKNKKFPYNINKELNEQNSHYPSTLIEDMKQYFNKFID